MFAKLGFRGYQPYERLGLWLRRELAPLVRRILLSDACLERGVFRPSAVTKAVEQHLSGGRNHTFLILAMMIFERGQDLMARKYDTWKSRYDDVNGPSKNLSTASWHDGRWRGSAR